MLCLTRTMRHSAHLAASAALVGFMLAGSGCGESSSTYTAPAPKSGEPEGYVAEEHAHEGHDHADHDHASHDHAGGDIEAALAKLSPEDRALAETQKVCLVAKEPLGSMGAPIKVEHNGQVAFLCCDGCREAFEADPEKYLAALTDGADAAATPEPAATPAAEPAPTADPAATEPAPTAEPAATEPAPSAEPAATEPAPTADPAAEAPAEGK